MPRTRQGVFRKIKNEYKRLEEEFEAVIAKYDYDDDFFTGLAQESNELYCELDAFIGDVRGMLNATAMEMETTEEEYAQLLKDANEKKNEIQILFKARVKKIKESGGYLSDSERDTIKELQISYGPDY